MKKGFTLIELLAVIIILAVIALIATPLILDVVSDAEEESRLQTVNGYIEATRMYITESILKDTSLEGNLYDIIKDRVKGTKPETGEIFVGENNKIAVALKVDGYCYIKNYDDIKATKTGDEGCTISTEVVEACFGREEKKIASYDVNVPVCVDFFTMMSEGSGLTNDWEAICNGNTAVEGETIHDFVANNNDFVEQILLQYPIIENLKYETNCISCFETEKYAESYDIDYNKCVEYMPTVKSYLEGSELDEFCRGEMTVSSTSIYKMIKYKELTLDQLLENGVITKVNYSGVSITDYKCGNFKEYEMPEYFDVVIPNKINGEPVTHIKDSAFLREGITSVDFSQAKNLKVIGDSAFRENSITSVELADLPNLETIEHDAFGMNQINSLTIKKLPKLKELNGFNTNLLTELNITSTDLPKLAYIGGFTNNKLTKLNLSSFTTLTNLYSNAFSYNFLEEINLPSFITSMGLNAFSNNQIKVLDLSHLSNLNTLTLETFKNNKISSLNLPPNLESLGPKVFSNNLLEEITIPSTVKYMNDNTFSSSTNTENVTFTKADGTTITMTYTDNISLSKIINKTKRPFDWNYVINGTTNTTFETGTVTTTNGTVTITNQ